jgi:acetyl esterase/lipase
MRDRAREDAPILTFGQHMTIAGSRMFFGALTGAIRMFRGAHPKSWRTLRYGIHREEILDYHAPKPGVAEREAVVFFHGGGWMMGTKDFYSHDLLFLTEAGHPVFNVEYPKAPEFRHPFMLRSVLKALLFIRMSFPQARAVHLMGDSAGGNLAVMAAVLCSNTELIPAVDPMCKIKKLPAILSATSLYGVLDRHTMMEPQVPAGTTILEAYGGPEVLKPSVDAEHAITPMDLTFKRHPPSLLVCGGRDVILASTELYAARLKNEGHAVTLKLYPDSNHAFFNFPDGADKTGVQEDIVAFLANLGIR